MKPLRYILALSAFFVASLAMVGCGSGISGDSVADVSGNPISTRAFDHWMYVAAKSQVEQNPTEPVVVPTDPPNFKKCIVDARSAFPQLRTQSNKQLKGECSQLFSSLSSQVMDFLIKAYWYQADASRLHIKVTNAQVLKAFNAAKAQQFPSASGFQQFLKSTGQTLEDVLFRFRINQIYMKLIAKFNKKVSSAQIQDYYNKHRSQFGSPETRNLRIVLTRNQGQALAAKAALSHGQSWKAVAKKYSIDPTSKGSGGLLTGVAKGTQDQALDAAAFGAPINKLLGPVKGQFGYYVFEVAKINKGSQQSLAQATPLIQQTLNSQQQSSAQSAVDTRAKKHWQSKTKCRKEYMIADCSGFKAPKSTTPSTAPGATPTTPGATSTTPGTTSTK